jgi:Protein of unknown function (DUF1279)
MPEPAPSAKVTLKVRIERLIAEYGPVAFVVYFTLFALVLVGFALAIQLGVSSVAGQELTQSADSSSTLSTLGTWGAAWVATKITQPVRILATLGLTPIVTRVIRRFKSPT